MEKLKCSSCGGHLKIEDNKEYAICEYCGAKYKLNEDLNVNIKLDDNMKELLDDGSRTLKYTSKTAFITEIVVIFIITAIVISIIVMNRPRTRITNTPDSNMDKYEEKIIEQIEKSQEKMDEEYKSMSKEADKDIFNLSFEHENGTNDAFFVKSTLDSIVRSNNKYDRKIALVYEGTETTNESEIVNIKQLLEGDYEVSIGYSDDGYVNKVIINKIN